MIHAYHVIFGAYGFWLPNDPRGSWSDFVGSWELVRFGRTTRSIARNELSSEEERQRIDAKKALKYPPICFSGKQAQAIGAAFGETARKCNFTIWACSIMPEHTHLVIARHNYEVESIVNLLKGAATREISRRKLHPLSRFAKPGKRPPKMWARGLWKVYLDTAIGIENAIRYVEENPVKEGLPDQRWSFISGFRGLDPGHVIYH